MRNEIMIAEGRHLDYVAEAYGIFRLWLEDGTETDESLRCRVLTKLRLFTHIENISMDSTAETKWSIPVPDLPWDLL